MRSVISSWSTSSRLSKAAYFGIGGSLSYDSVGSHPERSVMGDVIRSAIGRIQSPWNSAIEIAALNEFDLAALQCVMTTASELCADCEHRVNKPESAHCDLTVGSDASLYGGAFIILRGSTPIVSKAWVWRRSEIFYHSNRKELIALYKAVQAALALVTVPMLHYSTHH